MRYTKRQPAITRFNAVLLLLPVWIALYYFKGKIAMFIISDLFSLSSSNSLGQSLAFFINTSLKIFLLLTLVIFIMALIRSWFPLEKVRDRLLSMSLFRANLMAGVFGVLTPFCSCSAIPLFISFLEAGIPLGITFSFLIASPLVNEVIIIMLGGLFGIRVAVIYALSGLIIAITAGFIASKLDLERYLPGWLLNLRNERPSGIPKPGLESRINDAINTVKDILSRIWLYALVGIAVGSVIHGYVPETWLSTVLAKGNWYSLPLAVLTGIPLYSCSASVAPVAFALVDKGMPLGTALAFIMAVAGLSLPEFIILKKVLSARLLLIFGGIVLTGIILVGFLFFFLL
jgi:uncharacterized membrane protein YraQ (UPF0718 family)